MRKPNKPIPQELLDRLAYDETSPTSLRWREPGRGRRRDLRAGSVGPQGYTRVMVMEDGRRANILAHRLVWALHHGDPGELTVDHVDGDPCNNRIGNLQAITLQQNNARRLGWGAHFCQSHMAWKASIGSGGDTRHLGYFDTEEEARAAYLAAKAKATEGLQVDLSE